VVGLWKLIDNIPRDCWPSLLRGDSSIASEGVMRESEGRGINYLFKLRLTKNVKSLIERAFMKGGWSDAGQGWQGKAETLRLVGWSRHRRVIVLRRRLKEGVVADVREGSHQLRLSFAELEDDTQLYEYAVLVTSLQAEVLTIAQLYRDRADCEIDQSWRLSRISDWMFEKIPQPFHASTREFDGQHEKERRARSLRNSEPFRRIDAISAWR